jgi:ELWxxDGT repeat protein
MPVVTYFRAHDGTSGQELWVTDGTLAGTALVADLNPSGSFYPSGFTGIGNGRVVFQAFGVGTGSELWITDGTAPGTLLVEDIWGDIDSSSPSLFAPIGAGRAVFRAYTGAHGGEIFVTDGSADGTYLLRDIRPGAATSNPIFITPIGGGKAVFRADDGTTGIELWITDGTTAGTTLLKDINSGPSNSLPRDFLPVGGGRFVFSAEDAATGNELWVTDGTTEGTHLLREFRPGPGHGDPALGLALGGGKVLFSANSLSSGRELWVTDGTASGTRLLADIRPGNAGSYPDFVRAIGGGKAVFVVVDGTTTASWLSDGTGPPPGLDYFDPFHEELWITDGTPEGTQLVKDFGTGRSVTGPPRYLTAVGGGRVVFAAEDPALGRELWVTDGTADGTRVLKDINPDAASSYPFGFYAIAGGKAVFSVLDAQSNAVLWITDGTEAGTVLWSDMFPAAIAPADFGTIVPNTSPTLGTPLADQSATAGTAFSFTVPAGTFADADATDWLTLSATLADGGALPAWLSFAPATLTFSGTPPRNAASLDVRVTATDSRLASVSDSFLLTVTTPRQPVTITVAAGQSIQAAVDAASPGDTIIVAAGTFNEAVTVPHADLTILGANAFIAGNWTRGTETRVIGGSGFMSLQADGITIDGIEFVVSGSSRGIAPEGDGIAIRNSIFSGGEGDTSTRGVEAALSGRPHSLNVERNLFKTQYGVAGTEGMAGLTVKNNVFQTGTEAIGFGVGVSLANVTGNSFTSGTQPQNYTASAITLGSNTVGGTVRDNVVLGTGRTELTGIPADNIILAAPGNQVISGQTGIDTYDASGATAGVTINLSTGVASGSTIGTDQLIGIERARGSNAADTITGDGLANVFWGGGGDDTISGGDHDDALSGEAGNDTLDGDNGDDVLWGGAGADTLSGGAGHDRLDGGDGDDTLRGGDGRDELDGGAGRNTLIGGQGNDTLTGGNEGDTLWGQEGNDVIRGGSGNDDIRGGVGDDWLFGFGGADIIAGGDGVDIVRGGSGNDQITGGAGRNTLIGEDGNDTLIGGDEGDVLWGQVGDDTITGGAGIDAIRGGVGADVVTGGGGGDVIYGGDGGDRFVYRAVSESTAAAPDQIVDFVRAAGDRIDLRPIDADGNSGNGDTGFVWIGVGQAFTAPGQLRAMTTPTVGLWSVEANVNADTEADLLILVTAGTTPAGDWFLL